MSLYIFHRLALHVLEHGSTHATSILAGSQPRTFFTTIIPSWRLCLQHAFNIAGSPLPTLLSPTHSILRGI
jgi:hypothetical protein